MKGSLIIVAFFVVCFLVGAAFGLRDTMKKLDQRLQPNYYGIFKGTVKRTFDAEKNGEKLTDEEKDKIFNEAFDEETKQKYNDIFTNFDNGKKLGNGHTKVSKEQLESMEEELNNQDEKLKNMDNDLKNITSSLDEKKNQFNNMFKNFLNKKNKK